MKITISTLILVSVLAVNDAVQKDIPPDGCQERTYVKYFDLVKGFPGGATIEFIQPIENEFTNGWSMAIQINTKRVERIGRITCDNCHQTWMSEDRSFQTFRVNDDEDDVLSDFFIVRLTLMGFPRLDVNQFTSFVAIVDGSDTDVTCLENDDHQEYQMKKVTKESFLTEYTTQLATEKHRSEMAKLDQDNEIRRLATEKERMTEHKLQREVELERIQFEKERMRADILKNKQEAQERKENATKRMEKERMTMEIIQNDEMEDEVMKDEFIVHDGAHEAESMYFQDEEGCEYVESAAWKSPQTFRQGRKRFSFEGRIHIVNFEMFSWSLKVVFNSSIDDLMVNEIIANPADENRQLWIFKQKHPRIARDFSTRFVVSNLRSPTPLNFIVFVCNNGIEPTSSFVIPPGAFEDEEEEEGSGSGDGLL